jgi:hypothetical protein
MTALEQMRATKKLLSMGIGKTEEEWRKEWEKLNEAVDWSICQLLPEKE